MKRKQEMTDRQIIGVVFFVIGMGLMVFGLVLPNAFSPFYHSLLEKLSLSLEITGTILLGGIIFAVSGVCLYTHLTPVCNFLRCISGLDGYIPP